MALLRPSSHGFLPAARLKVRQPIQSIMDPIHPTYPVSTPHQSQTLSILATTEGYGAAVNEETRRLYGYSHVLEAGKPVTLRVMDATAAAGAAADGHFTYEWRVRQHDGADLLRCVCVCGIGALVRLVALTNA